MPVSPETRAMVLLAAQICEEKKGTDTRILELDPMDSGFTDFFLITSGNNTRQTGAIADEIELRMKHEFGTYAKSVEGRRQGEWILLDYVDFVVHIFTEQTREFYDIERLRKSARPLDTRELAAELNRKTEAARKKAPAKKALAKNSGEERAPLVSGAASLAVEGEPSKKAVKKAPAKKAAAKKAAAKKAPAKKAAAKKAAAKKAPAKKAPAKKSAAEKAPAKKAVAKKAPAKMAAKGAPMVEDTSLRALASGTPSKRLPAPS